MFGTYKPRYEIILTVKMVLLILRFSLCLLCCYGDLKVLENPRILIKMETKYSRSVEFKLHDYGWDFKERVIIYIILFVISSH